MSDIRPIDANKIKLRDFPECDEWGEQYGKVVGATLEDIKNTPTLDYAPVIHAKWIDGIADDKHCVVCSKCGSIIPSDTQIDALWVADNRFCYWCGAKMNLEEGVTE